MYYILRDAVFHQRYMYTRTNIQYWKREIWCTIKPRFTHRFQVKAIAVTTVVFANFFYVLFSVIDRLVFSCLLFALILDFNAKVGINNTAWVQRNNETTQSMKYERKSRTVNRFVFKQLFSVCVEQYFLTKRFTPPDKVTQNKFCQI